MAAPVHCYLVRYHYETGGKKSSVDYSQSMQLSTQTTDGNSSKRTSTPLYDAIRTVLSNNALLQGGTLVVDGVTCISNDVNMIA